MNNIISMLDDIIFDLIFCLQDEKAEEILKTILSIPISKIKSDYIQFDKENYRVNEEARLNNFINFLKKKGIIIDKKHYDLIEKIYYEQ